MPSIGPWEVLIVLIIALLVFGPKKLPEMGKSLGKGIREFKSSVTGEDERREHDEHDSYVQRAQELPPAAPPQPAQGHTVSGARGTTGTPR